MRHCDSISFEMRATCFPTCVPSTTRCPWRPNVTYARGNNGQYFSETSSSTRKNARNNRAYVNTTEGRKFWVGSSNSGSRDSKTATTATRRSLCITPERLCTRTQTSSGKVLGEPFRKYEDVRLRSTSARLHTGVQMESGHPPVEGEGGNLAQSPAQGKLPGSAENTLIDCEL